MSEITLQAKIADIESEQVVYPTSVGEGINLVVIIYINDFFLQITIIATLELRLTSRQGAKFMCSVYPCMKGDVSVHQMCTIRYTADPDYGTLSNPITILVGTAPVSLSLTTPGTMYILL